MGFFSKTPKPNPKITVEGIEVSFHREHDCWEFKYRGIDFISFGILLTLPAKAELDSILVTLESLKPEMKSRITKGPDGDGGLKLDDGESFMVDVQSFATERSLMVTWSGGASWGDMGVDFIIKDNAIIDESWGD